MRNKHNKDSKNGLSSPGDELQVAEHGVVGDRHPEILVTFWLSSLKDPLLPPTEVSTDPSTYCFSYLASPWPHPSRGFFLGATSSGGRVRVTRDWIGFSFPEGNTPSRHASSDSDLLVFVKPRLPGRLHFFQGMEPNEWSR